MSRELKPVTFSDVPPTEGIVWVAGENGSVPPGALVGGKDGSADVYVARAHHEGAVVPGKFVNGHKCAYVPWGCKENAKDKYEILVVAPEAVSWTEFADGIIPLNAIPTGLSRDGEVEFTGRAKHEGTVTVGKVHPTHKVLYIPYGGKEIHYDKYEVLVKNFF